MTEAHKCEQLVQGCYAALSRKELNPLPIDHKSNALLRHLLNVTLDKLKTKQLNLTTSDSLKLWSLHFVHV